VSIRDKGIDVALWILCVDCLLLIVWNSLWDRPETSSIPFGDKALHTGSYLALTFLLLLAAVWRPGRAAGGRGVPGLVVVLSVALFGILIEGAQGVIFERTADVADAVANVIGIGLAWAAWSMLRRIGTARR
jgi:VanZ family protein